jgi:D-threo-aldose 1-dehydrogenase
MTGTESIEGPSWIRPLGDTGLSVSAVIAGGAPLGSMPEAFGYEVSEDAAIDLVQAILSSPIRAIDTSNGYSSGRSEERIGMAIARAGGLPPDFLVATKVDADGADYSGERVRASVRESKGRLGLDHLPLVYLHDPEFHDFEVLSASGGAVETLVQLVEEGEIGHIGVAGGDVHKIAPYLDLGVFEVLLTHNRWTIVDRSATDLIGRAIAGGMAVVNAAIYGGGILADPTGGNTRYGYREATPDTLAAIRSMTELAREFGTDLPTVALQASLRDPKISSTVVGFSKPSRVEGIVQAASRQLPPEFWDTLETFVPTQENWLDFQSAPRE